MAAGLAIAIFVALFGWGANYFGWSDPEGKVRLAVAFNAGGELRFARRLVEFGVSVPAKSLADPSVKLKELVPEAAPRSLAA